MCSDERYQRIETWVRETCASIYSLEEQEKENVPSLKRSLPSPAPTDANMERDESPSKRQRIEHDNASESSARDSNVDIDRTPVSNASTELRPLTLQQFPPRPGSTTSSRKSRSTSPTKKTQILQALEKPISYVPLEVNATNQLPADVQWLYGKIDEITEDHVEIFPSSVREEISHALGKKKRDSWFYVEETNEDLDEHAVRSRSLTELSMINDILTEAQISLQRGRSEHAWNSEVHVPILKVALSRHPCVGKELVTTARISPPFLPTMGALGNSVDSKMVDLVLVLELDGQKSPESDKALAMAIRQKVWSQPRNKQSVNQTQYTPLHFSPIAVSIEAKATGSAEEGRTQLGVWTGAWHQRMHDFSSSVEKPRIITLPLLLIVEHDWKLYFACDRGHSLEIIGPISIGTTSSLTGIYMIVAVLRQLAVWVNSTFREWIICTLDLSAP